MAITQKEFDALVGKLENFSRKSPESYRFRVALFVILGYAYIFLVLAGLLTLIGLFISSIIFTHRVNAAALKFFIFLLIPVFIIVRSLWVTLTPPEGLKLNRGEFPKLFALVDELTTKLQAPKFDNILLNQDFNAAVVQIPRLGIFGW